MITYPGGNGDEIHAWLARLGGDGPAPGIVAVHHLPGWDEFYREFAERLARHGYIVICPDLYCRFGHGTPDDVAASVRSQGRVRDDSVVADCAAALSQARSQKAPPRTRLTSGPTQPRVPPPPGPEPRPGAGTRHPAATA